MTVIINESELRRALDSEIEPWELPHMRNLPNDIDPILLNRRIADEVNAEVGDWEALQLRTADWLTTHPLRTAVVCVAVILASAFASYAFPWPWGVL